jgi:hypothetical protein
VSHASVLGGNRFSDGRLTSAWSVALRDLYQAVAEGRRDAVTSGVRVVPAARFLDAVA